MSFKFYFIILVGKVNLPDPVTLPNDDAGSRFPYFFIGDKAFPLRPYLLRPYSDRALDCDAKKLFNYRLSRARRVAENSFGKRELAMSIRCYYFLLPPYTKKPAIFIHWIDCKSRTIDTDALLFIITLF